MALPAASTPDPLPGPALSGLILIDDLPFLVRISALAADLGIELRPWTEPIESIERRRFEHLPDFVIIDQLLTRSQLYSMARTIRRAIESPVFAISADLDRNREQSERGLVFLSRDESIVAIRRLATRSIRDSAAR